MGVPGADGVAEVGLLRLVAQRLAGPRAPDAAAAVRGLLAAQAQDLPGALTSAALRTASGSRDGVVAALAAGELVRSWPMRGTLHLTAAADLPWLLDLTAARMLATTAARRRELGLDEEALARARAVAEAALTGRALRREDLLAAWSAAGLDVTAGRGYHLLHHLAVAQVVCLGPLEGSEQLVVLLAEHVPAPRRLEREEALAELALRYYRGHGPATARDLARWAGLTAGDARTGTALARPALEVLDVDGTEHLLAPEVPPLLAAHRADAARALLLPGFDEYLLGYADRGAVLPAEFASRIVPGGNGVFRPVVVDAGQVVGTWRSTGRGRVRRLEAEPFTTFRAEVAAVLHELHAALPLPGT